MYSAFSVLLRKLEVQVPFTAFVFVQCFCDFFLSCICVLVPLYIKHNQICHKKCQSKFNEFAYGKPARSWYRSWVRKLLATRAKWGTFELVACFDRREKACAWTNVLHCQIYQHTWAPKPKQKVSVAAPDWSSWLRHLCAKHDDCSLSQFHYIRYNSPFWFNQKNDVGIGEEPHRKVLLSSAVQRWGLIRAIWATWNTHIKAQYVHIELSCLR